MNAPISQPLPKAFWSPVTTEFGQALPGISPILNGLPKVAPESMPGDPLVSQNCPAEEFANVGAASTEWEHPVVTQLPVAVSHAVYVDS